MAPRTRRQRPTPRRPTAESTIDSEGISSAFPPGRQVPNGMFKSVFPIRCLAQTPSPIMLAGEGDARVTSAERAVLLLGVRVDTIMEPSGFRRHAHQDRDGGIADLNHDVDRDLAQHGDRAISDGSRVRGGLERDPAFRLLLTERGLALSLVERNAGGKRAAEN